MKLHNQTQINDTAWAACAAFRGNMTARQTRDYALALFFLKYMSDAWQIFLLQNPADAHTRVDRRLQRARFVLPQVNIVDATGLTVIDSFSGDIYSLNMRREHGNIGELIDLVLLELEKRNKAKLDRLFHHISFNNEAILGPKPQRNIRLKHMLTALAYLDLRNQPEAIGPMFQYLIQRFANEEGKNANTPHTSQSVARLLAALVKPKAGEQIADPVCGDANLLIEAANYTACDQFTMFGQEQDPATWALARMNLFIHGYDGTRLELGNTLSNPLLLNDADLMRFDVVLAHPPILVKQWLSGRADQDPFRRYWRGAPPRSKAEFAFISHLVEITRRRTGRLAVITSHGVLFRGVNEGRIRQRLITENLLDAVIALPAQLCPNATTPMVILLFDRSREVGSARSAVKDVMLFDVGRYLATNRSSFAEQIHHIVANIEARKAQSPYSYLASQAEIVANDYDLNLPRFLYDREQDARLDLSMALQEIAQLEQELGQLRAQLKRHFETLYD